MKMMKIYILSCFSFSWYLTIDVFRAQRLRLPAVVSAVVPSLSKGTGRSSIADLFKVNIILILLLASTNILDFVKSAFLVNRKKKLFHQNTVLPRNGSGNKYPIFQIYVVRSKLIEKSGCVLVPLILWVCNIRWTNVNLSQYLICSLFASPEKKRIGFSSCFNTPMLKI